MANKGFHDEAFDESTLVKLEIFRQYVREWFPVFMTKKKKDGGLLYKQINIFDYFAGPGRDVEGKVGSPLIILEELKAFCEEHEVMTSGVPVGVYFNDECADHIKVLRGNAKRLRCSKGCCHIEYGSLPFQEAYHLHLRVMQQTLAANLIILDQFGVSDVSPEIVRELLACGTTDILFFISSSFVYRFIETPEIQKHYKIDPKELRDVEYKVIHRYVCDYFRQQLGETDAYIAPFSIKKGRNIYGVVFATKNKLGVEKFLKICWGIDAFGGEANYNIDNELGYEGETLFAEYNKPSKVSVFEKTLYDEVCMNEPDNRMVYRFCLEHGFHSVKANEILRELQSDGRLLVHDLETGNPARRNSFYLKDKERKVIYKGKR